MMVIIGRFVNYWQAEEFADKFKGDTRETAGIHVVEDFDPALSTVDFESRMRFLVVLGDVPSDMSDRYEVQYTACLVEG